MTGGSQQFIGWFYLKIFHEIVCHSFSFINRLMTRLLNVFQRVFRLRIRLGMNRLLLGNGF